MEEFNSGKRAGLRDAVNDEKKIRNLLSIEELQQRVEAQRSLGYFMYSDGYLIGYSTAREILTSK